MSINAVGSASSASLYRARVAVPNCCFGSDPHTFAYRWLNMASNRLFSFLFLLVASLSIRISISASSFLMTSLFSRSELTFCTSCSIDVSLTCSYCLILASSAKKSFHSIPLLSIRSVRISSRAFRTTVAELNTAICFESSSDFRKYRAVISVVTSCRLTFGDIATLFLYAHNSASGHFEQARSSCNPRKR